jgi:hypothetical protein
LSEWSTILLSLLIVILIILPISGFLIDKIVILSIKEDMIDLLDTGVNQAIISANIKNLSKGEFILKNDDFLINLEEFANMSNLGNIKDISFDNEVLEVLVIREFKNKIIEIRRSYEIQKFD